jgi:hypothetical protein
MVTKTWAPFWSLGLSPRFIKKALGIHIGLHNPFGGGGGASLL